MKKKSKYSSAKLKGKLARKVRENPNERILRNVTLLAISVVAAAVISFIVYKIMHGACVTLY